MPFMKQIIADIKTEGIGVPVIIGGAPVSEDFADTVGAEGYGDNAPLAVSLCKKLVLEAEAA